MGIIVSSLPAYVEQQRLPLIHKAVLGAKTAGLVNRQSGVKGTAALNLVNTTPALQDGSACSWNASGDATLTQRNIVTKPISVMMEFCDKSLLGKWAEYQVRIAAGEKQLPFEQDFTEDIANRISEKVENLLWKGLDFVAGGDKDILGLLDIAKADATECEIPYGTTAFEAIKKVILAIPAAVLPKAVVFVGTDTYRQFVMECMEKNLYHYAGADGAMEYVFPGTDTRIIAVNGLNAGTGEKRYAVAADPDNLFYGYDVENADQAFDIWYSKDDKIFKFNCEFNAGTQIAYPAEVIYANLDPDAPTPGLN